MTGGRRAPRAFVLAVDPEQFAGSGIERDDGSARAGGRIDHALDHDGRALEFVFGPCAEAVSLEAPGNFQLAEVRRIDLIERRIAVVVQISGVGRPLAVLGAGEPGLRGRRRRHPNERHCHQEKLPKST